MQDTTTRSTVRATIRAHLLRVGNISGMEAAGMYKCRHLPSRIFELKQEGMNIISVRRRDAAGQKYVRYVLAGKIATDYSPVRTKHAMTGVWA